MAIQRYRIVHTDQDSFETDITEAVDIQSDEGIEATVDKFKFSVNNVGGKYDGYFKVNNKIDIYFDEGPATPTTLVMAGFITHLQKTINFNRKRWVITGSNRLEHILTFLLPVSETSTTAPEVINNLISRINDFDLEANKTITADLKSNGGQIDDTTWTNFPTINYYRNDTPAFQVIEELSNDEFTNNGTYIYYLDTNNVFYWKPRPTTATSTITEGTDFISMSIEEGVFEVVNAVTLNAGVDFKGKPVKEHYYDIESASKNGFKWKYVPFEALSEKFKRENNVTVDNDFPYGNAADYTGGNAQFRSDLKVLAKEKGKEIVKYLGNARYRVNMTVRGTTNYVKGDLYTIVSPSMGWTDQKLRLVDIGQRFSSRGWRTTLFFEEDEMAAIERLVL